MTWMVLAVIVSAPSQKETRSVFADWAEILILSGAAEVNERRIIRSLAILSEPDHQVDLRIGNELVDEEILETESTELTERVYNELAYRQNALGELYPFELVSTYGRWSLVKRAEDASVASAREAYVTLLLISGLHSTILPLESNDPFTRESRAIMQIQAYLTAGVLLGGEAFWFGFPRPEGTNMLDAVTDLVAKMGIGAAAKERPQGVPPNEKDGTVDIVAWRGFRDGVPPFLVAYGQVAAGNNWDTKPINAFFEEKFVPWFDSLPSFRHIFLHFIPWIQHHKQREELSRDFYQEARAGALLRERTYGIMLDRIRISELMLVAEDSGRLTQLEPSTHLARSRRWKDEALTRVTRVFA